MTLTAALLLLAAAATHAAWNALGKHAQPTPAFLLVGNTLGALCLLPAIGLYGRALYGFSAAVWGWLVLTGLCQAAYYVGLAGAYRAGDMSLAYPLVRALPVVLVALVNVALGRAEQIGRQALVGMLAVGAGGVLLGLRPSSEGTCGHGHRHSRWQRMRSALTWRVGGWVALAALGTTGYSLVDDQALRLVRAATASAVPPAGATAVFALFEGLLASCWLGLAVAASRAGRHTVIPVLRRSLGAAALTGVGIHLAYTLVLVAMGFVRNVSYVVAFRQVSVLLGTMLGVAWLKEPGYPGKFIGAGMLTAGLVLVGLG